MDDIVGKTGKHSGGLSPYEAMEVGRRIAPGGSDRRRAAMAAAAFTASTMAITGVSATAFAATTGNSAAAKSHVSTGAIVSQRSFPSANMARKSMTESVSATTSAASRSYSRDETEGTWELSEDFDVPVTRSTDEKNAASALQAAVDMGNSKLSESDGKVADDATRTTLKQAVDAATPKIADVKTSADDLRSAAAAISDSAAKVDESMRAKQAADQQAASSSQQAAGSASSGGDYGFTFTAPAGQSSSDVVNYAMQFVGKVPYVWAGSDTSGWDCSGMVAYVFRHFGVNLPHYSGAQAQVGRAIGSLADAQPGDIIANSTHAAIYIGNGMVVNALNPSEGTTTTPIQWAFRGGYSIRRVIG